MKKPASNLLWNNYCQIYQVSVPSVIRLMMFIREIKCPFEVILFAWVKLHTVTLQWGAVVAEIKVPSGENTELKRSPFKAWSGSVYSYTCYAYCQGFLPCLFLPFRSIHLHFFQNLPPFFLCWLRLTHGSCVGPQNKIGYPAGCMLPCWVPMEYK